MTTMPQWSICFICDGSGEGLNDSERCFLCEGRGIIFHTKGEEQNE